MRKDSGQTYGPCPGSIDLNILDTRVFLPMSSLGGHQSIGIDGLRVY